LLSYLNAIKKTFSYSKLERQNRQLRNLHKSAIVSYSGRKYQLSATTWTRSAAPNYQMMRSMNPIVIIAFVGFLSYARRRLIG
jgi:hypothetical protein